MKLNNSQVAKVAQLAQLHLTENEQEQYSDQLSKLLDYIDQLNGVPTDVVVATYNVNSNINVLENDQKKSSLSQSDALKNAVHAENGLFVTKGVFDNE